MEEYVKNSEFNVLKERVDKMEDEMADNKALLITMDKKLDIIGERLKSDDKINELKNENIITDVKNNKEKIKDLEDNQKKFVWSIVGEVLALIFLAVRSFLQLKS